MAEEEINLRRSLVKVCKEMKLLGLTKGTSGNVSVRLKKRIFITPSGISYDKLGPEQIVELDMDGNFTGDYFPSSEWRFHCDILRQRKDLNAVVHTHSLNATAVSILGHDIPSIHYRIAAIGGPDIKCTDYATFGTEVLANLAVEAMKGLRACLLAHHGVIAAHTSLGKALEIAELVEELASLYLLCLPMGQPPQLSSEEIDEVIVKHRTYGQQKND